ncbi:MAG TPA: NAD(P)-binding domain-containing protein [Chthoniobacterales bacterium]
MSRRTRKNIGLVGLGLIGDRVRDVLRRKGFQVFVWNRTPRPVPNFVGAPAELAEMCDFIQVFVSDDDALLFVVKQLSPALSARHIVIAHSTVSPHTMIAAGEIVERRGARFIEAPFTGSKEAAEKGELVYYVGGDKEALLEARPLLQASSKEVLEIGEIGQATAIKVATNMVTAATVQATAEALALTQATGLPGAKFLSAMQQNATYSKTLAMKLPKMIERNFDRHFSVQHMLKDMQIANRLGLSNHLELGVTAAARDRLLEQMQRGHGDEDYSAVARKYVQDTRPATEADLELFQRRSTDQVQPEAKLEEKAKTAPQPEPKPELHAGAKTEPSPEAKVEMREPEPKGEAIVKPEPRVESAPPESAAVPAASSPSEPASLQLPAEEISAQPASALEALQTHVPAAPFIHPVRSSEPAAEPVEHGARNVAVETSHDFLSESAEPLTEEQGSETRGFFSRLLRRVNT